MAAKARTGYPCVIECRRRPASRLVTIFTDVARYQMRRVLARRLRTVMAGRTVSCYSGVHKRCGGPCRRLMAILTNVAGC
jgi:hypothetical protein